MGPPPVVTPLAAEGPGPLLVLETVEPLAAELVAVPVTALPVTALLVPLAVPVAHCCSRCLRLQPRRARDLPVLLHPQPSDRCGSPSDPTGGRGRQSTNEDKEEESARHGPVKRTQPSHSSFGSSLLQTCLWQEADEGVERDEALCFCQCTSPMSQDWQGTSTSSGDAPP